MPPLPTCRLPALVLSHAIWRWSPALPFHLSAWFLQVVDAEVQLGMGDCHTSPGIILRTGPIMLVSSDPQQHHQQQQQQQKGKAAQQQAPHHVLTAAEAAAHLSAVTKQRRIARWLGLPGAVGEAGGAASTATGGVGGLAGHPSGTSLDAAAAVAAVEQHLLYTQFELSVAELQATAVNLPLAPVPGSDAGGRGTSSPTEVAGSGSASGGPFGRQWHTVLQPLQLSGTLKMHRIAEVRGGAHEHTTSQAGCGGSTLARLPHA